MPEIFITVIHPTARTRPTEAFPEGWREAERLCRSRCSRPVTVEYILVAHSSRFDDLRSIPLDGWGNSRVLRNDGRDCGVDQVNACIGKIIGKIIVILQDDMFPPQDWDLLLLDLFRNQAGELVDLDRDAVVHVSSGRLTVDGWELPARNDSLFNPQIMTSTRVNRLGYIGWPEYTSMYSDDEFSEHARLDGCVIDARHIVFEHRHPIFGGQMDGVYRIENAPEAYRAGAAIFERRRAAGFPGKRDAVSVARSLFQKWGQEKPEPARRPLIGVCTPGQVFSSLWVDSWAKLFGHLITRGWNVVNMFGYSTSVHVARMSMADHMGTVKPRPDFLLWIDDDNLLSIEQFEMLAASLQAAEKEDPNVQIVAGWCWMKCEDLYAEPKVSCGWKNATGGNCPMPYELMQADPRDLIEIEWTGFPVVLMRYAAIERAGGAAAFLPYLDPSSPWGFLSEDMAFSQRYREAGGRMLVDRRVKVPHLKLQPAEPRGQVPGHPVSGAVESLAV